MISECVPSAHSRPRKNVGPMKLSLDSRAVGFFPVTKRVKIPWKSPKRTPLPPSFPARRLAGVYAPFSLPHVHGAHTIRTCRETGDPLACRLASRETRRTAVWSTCVPYPTERHDSSSGQSDSGAFGLALVSARRSSFVLRRSELRLDFFNGDSM